MFSSAHWPGCAPVKEALSQAGVEFVYMDISSGMLPLKRSLKYRDSRPEFDPMKEKGRTGLPCLVISEDGHEEIVFPTVEDVKNIRN